MTNKLVLIDFAGTLVKAEIIEEANEFRAKLLEKSLPSKEEHANPEELYKSNNEFVEKLTGLKKDMVVRYRNHDLSFTKIKGEDFHNQISTNLFQIGMFMTAKKHKEKICPEGFVEQLQRIKKLGYKLTIVSGVRTDIISGMLKIAQILVEFDYIYGQPPVLGVSNEDNMAEIKKHGKIEFVIGDKMNDLEAGKTSGAKTIFVTWGHPSGGEEAFADYTIDECVELEKIIK